MNRNGRLPARRNVYLPLLRPSTARPTARFATVDRLGAGEERPDIAGRCKGRVISVVGSGMRGLTSAHGRNWNLFRDNQQDVTKQVASESHSVAKPVHRVIRGA